MTRMTGPDCTVVMFNLINTHSHSIQRENGDDTKILGKRDICLQNKETKEKEKKGRQVSYTRTIYNPSLYSISPRYL